MDWEVELSDEKNHPFLYYSNAQSSLMQELPTGLGKMASTAGEGLELEEEALKEEALKEEALKEDGLLGQSEVGELSRSMGQIQEQQIDFLSKRHFTMVDILQYLPSSLESASFTILILLVIYILISLFWTIRTDLHLKSHEMYLELNQEIKDCSNHYQVNACHLDLPAIRSLCQEWKICMNKPVQVGGMKITVGYIVEILNALFEPISIKSITIVIILIIARISR